MGSVRVATFIRMLPIESAQVRTREINCQALIVVKHVSCGGTEAYENRKGCKEVLHDA